MKKLAVFLFALPLAFAVVPASAAKRSDTCYVVREHGKYARAGKPVRKCPVGSRRGIIGSLDQRSSPVSGGALENQKDISSSASCRGGHSW